MTFEQAYDYDVVVISVFAIASVYAVIHLAGSASGPGRWRRIAWLAAGTAILGGGYGSRMISACRFLGLRFSTTTRRYGSSLWRRLSHLLQRSVRRSERMRPVPMPSVSKLGQKPSLRLSGLPMLPAGPTYMNKRWFQMTGTSEQEVADGGWVNEVHLDDRAPLSEKWQACVQSGETFEIEYRCLMRPRGTAGIWIALCLCVTIMESSGSGLEPAPTPRSRSTINNSSSSRSRSALKNWPTPPPACNRKCGKKTSPAGRSMNTTTR
jgi:hypothetical protein